ncbi:MAG: methyltransferase domain-containing protein [Pegethrix bostrychoides GSE-TBD4-15B]|jgi:malonyl-CoA O-methyltransferase|uniref:Methyltransferase domain-containing protein n=1 Tax=Pegethrix bostrychoides GSE-TBD4-15B TaxID=2839662 RepID=A0A951U3W2_9CYAN|nr:methyltransferase domain-containing protein [Pegethrix bostrychoides GSE-TBD4-15B]
MSSDQPITDPQKQRIARQFGQSAPAYNANAKLQYQGAQHLLELIQTYQNSLPSGDILEIGCGTGFITQGLIQCFADRSLEITDLSPDMLKFCQRNLVTSPEQASRISFYQLDAEVETSKQYASIISGFTTQWFRELYQTISLLLSQLHINGILFLSFPGSQSFPEWRAICNQLNLPFTANPLPDLELLLAEMIHPLRILHLETDYQITHHTSAADFFRELKAIGAGVSQQQLSVSQMKRLIRIWDAQASGQVDVHHQIIYLAVQRIV